MKSETPRPLTFAELAEIDRLAFSKADTTLQEARTFQKCLEYDLAVRRSQEAFELYVKSLLRYLQMEYPSSHDLRKQVYALADALKPYPFDKRQVARLAIANGVLAFWRSPSFYGEEKLGVGTLFNASEAALAVSYAELGGNTCGVVRELVYRKSIR